LCALRETKTSAIMKKTKKTIDKKTAINIFALILNFIGVFRMLVFLIFVHVIICAALVLVILIQTSKGGLDANFGGIASNALGTQGATEFVKTWTKILFVAFLVSCVLLAATVRNNEGGGGRRGGRLGRAAQQDLENVVPMEAMPIEAMPIETIPMEGIQMEVVPQQQQEPIVIEIGDWN